MTKSRLSAPDRIKFLPKINLSIPNIDVDGLVLNLAHGGEDVINQCVSGQIVAINIAQKELEDVSDDCLKILMNPCDLKIVNASFELVTAFFSLLFIGCDQYQQLFNEVFRVLQPGGRLLIWEVVLPVQNEPAHDIVAVPIDVKTPQGLTTAGYGALWPPHPWTAEQIQTLAGEAGFVIDQSDISETYFHFECRKPAV